MQYGRRPKWTRKKRSKKHWKRQRSSRAAQERAAEWVAGISYAAVAFAFVYLFIAWCLQFQYNPEWFQDEEDGDASDDWDLSQYRREQEEDNLAAEELRIANVASQNAHHAGVAESSGDEEELSL